MSDDAAMPPPASASTSEEKSDSLPSVEERATIEKQQEKILKSKYPANRGPMGLTGAGAPAAGGHSAFLQKRLAKGAKYFDSGDYQMAQQKKGRAGGAPRVGLTMPVLAQPSTGDTIPTPDLVPHRKTSIIQPLHDHTMAMHLASDPAHLSSEHHGKPLLNPAIAKLAL